MKAYKTIDEYLKDYPADIQTILQKIRKTIQEAAPEAEEAVRYGMPTFRFKEKNMIHFAAFKNHLSIFPGPQAIEEFTEGLFSYQVSKGTIQFQFHQTVPYPLIKKIVQFKMKKIDEKIKKGKLITCSRGHQFYKTKDQPSCPVCWPGKYKKK